MAAFQILISPPARKPTPQKLEKVEEVIPRLILAPFNPNPEIKFGEVLLNSAASRNLMIFNPSPSVSIRIQFGNIDAEDRIFISEVIVQLNPREEKQVTISWSPIHSGYLRKVIRAQDASRKARSFDVVLSGMAVNKVTENKKKRQKPEAKKAVFYGHKSGFESNTTFIQPSNQQSTNDLRRQTYTIDEKENRMPVDYSVSKNTFKASSPKTEFSNLNVLQENSIMNNFSRSSFASYDTVDAPTKYSNFESELDPSNLDETNPMVIRRSTFSMNFEAEPGEVILSPPQPCSGFSISLEGNSPSLMAENITFDLKSGDGNLKCEENVCLTPQKTFSLDSLLISPPANLAAFPTSVSKSSHCLYTLEESYSSYCSTRSTHKNELLLISPPNKSCRSTRKSPEKFVHRTESSAIKDRKKHLRTSFMSRRRTPPSSAKKFQGHGRFSSFMAENSVEKIKSHNPRALKQAVSSQCHIEDPFLKQVLYNDDQWMDDQEKEIIKWMNSVLVPQIELDEEKPNWTVDAAESWLTRNRSGNSVVWSVNKVPVSLYNAPEKVALLRRRSKALREGDLVSSVFHELRCSISKKIISVRDGRDICADEGIKNKLLQLLACYNPLWLRMALEVVYGQEIALQPKADIGGLGLFIRRTVLFNCSMNKKTSSQKEEIRKNILLRFFQLIFFMDQARIHRLFRHNRCLFTLESQYKSSQDVLNAFIRDLVTCRIYIGKHLKSIGYHLQFKQTCVDEYDYTIVSLKDLNDGVRLTRLFEILFAEPDLCSRLRVPAVDIENKKHNVDVAMRAAKNRCTIEGRITAEDFVLASRVGSRIKILSFLWQVVNNYLTPLYEKAALTIQRWWRQQFRRLLADRMVAIRRDRGAVTIQAAWRGHIVRRHFAETLYHSRRRTAAAVAIQRWYRTGRLIKACVGRFRELGRVAIVVQRRYRANVARNRFRALRRAVVVVQRRYRALKAMKECRSRFEQLKETTIAVQRRYRAVVAMRTQRTRFMALRRAAIIAQWRYRATKLMIECRDRFAELKRCTIWVQRRYRANLAMRVQRSRYVSLKQAAITVQRRYRSVRSMVEYRNRFERLKKYAIWVQQRYRANVATRTQRTRFLLVRQASITIQRRYRAAKLMAECRGRFDELKRCSILVQRRYRAIVDMHAQRNRFNSLRQAAIIVQRRYRAAKQSRDCRDRFLRLKMSTMAIQRRYRATVAMRAQRNEFILLRRAAIVVQRRYRASKVMTECRGHFELLKRSSVAIQRWYRAAVAGRIQRTRFTLMRQATITIQRRYRATKLMIECRNRFEELKRCSMFVQRRYRANVATRVHRERFMAARQAAVTVQQWYRSVKLALKYRDQLVRLKWSAIYVQRLYRANVAMRTQRTRYQSLRQAAVFVQRRYRATKLTVECRSRFDELKKCSVLVQRRYRANVAMRAHRDQFIRLRQAAIAVQRWYRAAKQMREYRDQFQRLKKSAVRVQQRYRATVAMHAQRNLFMSLRRAAIAVQRRYRATKLTAECQYRFALLKSCATVIQRRYRAAVAMRIERNRYVALRRAAITVQRRYRNRRLARECGDRYAALKCAAVVVQRLYRANVAMRTERARFIVLKRAAMTTQRRYRAVRLTRVCRAAYVELREWTVIVQQRWRTKMTRCRFMRIRAAVVRIQRWWRATRSRRKVTRIESRRNAAAARIQALWRGYAIRKKNILLKTRPSLTYKKEKENPELKSTLAERYKKAIHELKTSDLYSVVTIALWNLERVTTFSAKLCEGVVREGIAPIIFHLIARGNRSVPALVLYRASIGILINLTLYQPTKVILWNNMDKVHDILLILHLMKITHNQFLRKDEIDVFRYSVTFLWLLCQDQSIAEFVMNIPNVHQQIDKMRETLLRTCPCSKKRDAKRVARTLPNTQAKWYAEPMTRTFDDNCFALYCLSRSLYSR